VGREETVERALPRREVDGGGPGQDAVEVEEADADGIREAQGPGSWHVADATGAACSQPVRTVAVA
jgi:hypothetical protein